MGEAKAFTLSLAPFEVAQDLVKQMLGHSQTWDTYYRKISAALQHTEDKARYDTSRCWTISPVSESGLKTCKTHTCVFSPAHNAFWPLPK